MIPKITYNKSLVICPGCGQKWHLQQIANRWNCSDCGYENELEPFRLLTVNEILKTSNEFNDVKLGPFVKSLLEELEVDNGLD